MQKRPLLKGKKENGPLLHGALHDLYNNVHIVISGVREEVSFAIGRG